MGQFPHQLTTEERSRGGRRVTETKASANSLRNLRHGRYAKKARVKRCVSCEYVSTCPYFQKGGRCRIEIQALKTLMTNLKTKDFEGILSEIIKNFVRMSFLVETSNDFTAIVQFQKLLMEFSRLKIEAGFNTKEQGTLDMNEVFERINKALERRRAYSAQNSSAAKAQSAYSGPG